MTSIPLQERLGRSEDATKNHRDTSNETLQVFDPGFENTSTTSILPRDGKHQGTLTGNQLGIVMCSITLVAFLMILDLSIIATAIPHITTKFHSLPDVGWYGSAYLLTKCSVQPLSGKLYTHLNVKFTFVAFLAVFEFGSLLCGLANSSNMLVVGRAVAGMGASGLMNGTLTIIAACVPMIKRPAFLGRMFSLSQIGIVLGPLLGGAFTEYTTWRWCFYINLPIGAIAAIFIFLIHIPNQDIKTTANLSVVEILKQLDLLGFALFASFATQLLLALQWGGSRYPWKSATIIVLFCGSFVTFAAFIHVQRIKRDAAMIPFFILGKRCVWSASLVWWCFFGSMMCFSYYMPMYFQVVKNATPTMSAVYMLPAISSQILFATVSGVIVGRLGYYLPWCIASGAFASLGTGLLSTLKAETPTGKWVSYQILAGAGRGMGVQMPIVAIQNLLEPEQVPIAVSTAVFSQTFGGAIFLSLAQILFTNGLKYNIPNYAPSIDPKTIIQAGATAARQVVPSIAMEGVLEAYSASIGSVFCLAAAGAFMTIVFCWGLGWRSIKGPREQGWA